MARSFNHSGAGQEERFLLPALVARAVALRAAAPNTPMIVGNTSPIRDFLHVSDVAAAYISLCKGGSPGESYNVAASYLRQILGFIGITDVSVVLAGQMTAIDQGQKTMDEFAGCDASQLADLEDQLKQQLRSRRK